MAKISILSVQVNGSEKSQKLRLVEDAARKANIELKSIDFYTTDMEGLLLVAKHRILPEPTVLLFDRTKVVGRFVGDDIPTPERLESIVKLLEMVI